MSKTQILTPIQIHQKIERLAWQVYEGHSKEKELVLAGIEQNGYVLAEKMMAVLNNISDIKTTLVKVTVNKANPLAHEVKLDEPLDQFKNKNIVIVDDVLNSGKTLIYGVAFFLTIPIKKITTAVLVDRNHKRFPVKADVKGLSLSTSLQENVEVDFTKNGGVFLH